MNAPVTHLSGNEFDQLVIDSERPVVVDFWAPWCDPCRVVDPRVERLASEHPELRVAKLNVDEAPAIAARYRIFGIPTVIRFERGRETAKVIGAAPYEELADTLADVPVANARR